MRANLLRRAALLGSSQQKLSFQQPRKVETRDACTQWEPTYDNFDQSCFEIQIQIKQEVIKEAVQIEEKAKQPAIKHQQIPAKVDYQCKECNEVFPSKSTYKRNLRDIHKDVPRLNLKHQKKDGKYVCEFCEKPYSHTRDFKVHLKKQQNQSFVFIHEPTGNRFLQKRRSRSSVESLRVEVQKQVKMKKAVKNFPVSEINKIMVKIEAMKIPILKIIDLDSCLESYLTLEDKIENRVITDDQYARYMHSISFLLMTSSKCNLLMSIMLFKRQSQISAGISSSLMLFYLVKIMQPLSFLSSRRFTEYNYLTIDAKDKLARSCSKQLRVLRASQARLCLQRLKAREHHDELQASQSYIIDFNRAQRVQAFAQGNVYGTPGYFPERGLDRWRHLMGYLGYSYNNNRERHTKK